MTLTGKNYGIYGILSVGAANTQNWTGSSSAAVFAGLQTLVGCTGTITNLNSFRSAPYFRGGVTITNLSHYRVVNVNNSGPTFVNQTGLYIEALSEASTLNDAIYIAGANRIHTAGFFEQVEMAAPGAGAANTHRMYALEGAGDALTDSLMVYQDGSTDKFAEETTPDNSPLFATPSGTPLLVRLRKDHPGQVRIVAIFPSGEEFDLKCHEFHDAKKIAANLGCESPLPQGWEVTTLQERVDKQVVILDAQIVSTEKCLLGLASEKVSNTKRLKELVGRVTKVELEEREVLQDRQLEIPVDKERVEGEQVTLERNRQLELNRLAN